ncbi:MAG: hypothetical protein GTN46_08610 [Gammaproteobacteria bacterium]|nr:hypothetical protein [Gammaproteobacteria bacterium]NIO62259.1 hypothetical protein [Gammaproteobacteria bacterium]NIQ19931.1 hypothetical protein [Gammaproteobacteria bacterium]NIT41553.1 hypothetical protein [Gammaproteobacteria bacterium]
MRTTMRSITSLLTTLFIFALSPAVQAGDYRLYDSGMDGFEYYYEVSCNDPYARGTIVVKYEEREVEEGAGTESPDLTSATEVPIGGDVLPTVVEICLQGDAGNDRCKSNWTVTKAAQSFCK